MRYFFFIGSLLYCLLVQAQEDRRPIAIDDYFKLKSVRNPQISPDGEWVAYTLRETNLKKDKSDLSFMAS